MRSFCLPAMLLLLTTAALAQEAVPVIPLKPDPPIAVDGDLKEWTGVPNALSVRGKEHASYIPTKWKNDADLSAEMHLAWRQEGLYFGLDIADDAVCQTQHNEKMFQGDHVEVFLDTRPEVDPERRTFGPGQFQFGFSPGNFSQTGDALTDIKPEVISYQPKDGPTTGIKFAAVRTEKGYVLEILIPFALLGVSPLPNMPLGLEVAVSDCDSPEPAQEKMVTIGTKPWEYSRLRLPLLVLGDVAGKGTPPPRTVKIADEIVVKPGASQEVPVPPLTVQPGKDGYLFFKARLPFAKPAGYNPAMTAWLNGQPLALDRVTNRPAQSKRNEGTIHSFITGEGLIYVPYGPNFTAADSSPDYGLADGTKVHEWQFRVTDLLKPAGSVLKVSNFTETNVKLDLILGQVELRVMAPPPPPKPRRPAPTGSLAVCEPRQWPQGLVGKPVLGDGKITLNAAGENFTVESRFSTPEGKWLTGSNPFFSHSRQVEAKGCYLLVRDTFKNLTTENLPLMQRHSCDLKDRGKQFWCSGISPASGEIAMSDPQNPTSYATTAKAGLGFMPLNDEFLVHVTNSSLDRVLGLSDNNLVLPPGKEYTAQWAIIVTDRPDFWDFVNLARDVRGANFTLQYMFAFLGHGTRTEGWSDEKFTQFIRGKSANVVSASIDNPRYNGHYTHGTSFQHVDLSSYKTWTDRVRRLCPGVKTQVYFHCFLDVLDDADKLYPDARVLLANGQQANYGQPYDRIFFPTLTNAFGRDVAKNVDLIFDTCKADGVYWDEMDYSAYKYHLGEPWDGCTGDIDAKTGRLIRLKSSVSLLSLPFRKQLAEKIMARGPLVCNGAPHTKTMLDLHYEGFVETAAISNCLRAILYSPIALGDHISERKEIDCYRWMTDALNYGCLYSWYPDSVQPEYETLTKYMFPSTPVELHEGYLLAKERIVTNRSGLFGWGDTSRHEVHVFNDEGREVPDFKAPTVIREGKTYTELRIAEGWTAVIVRR